MSRLVSASLLLIAWVAAIGYGLFVNWNTSDGHIQSLPSLRVVTARPISAGKKIERADVGVELTWGRVAPDRIGRVQQVVGLQLVNPLAPGAPVNWSDLESTKNMPVVENKK